MVQGRRSRTFFCSGVVAAEFDPPVLLIIGDFPQAHTWYEGAVRVGLGAVGALIVWAVFGLTRRRWVRPA